jgi:CheY-like chemotaxis protein
MLQNLSSRVKFCLEKAAEARRRAAESKDDPFSERDFLLFEDNWNILARLEEFRERLEQFIASQRDADEVSRLSRVEPSTVGRIGDRGTLNFGKRLIAIVDDDDVVRGALQGLIWAFGYAAHSFATAEDYLVSNLIRDTACLISDVHLPGISGPDLQVRLIADGYRIPIIFLTGVFDERVGARVLQAGAVDYLAKPCNPQQLIDRIERALTRVSS